MFCKKCGNSMGEGVEFCPKCGNKVENKTKNISNVPPFGEFENFSFVKQTEQKNAEQGRASAKLSPEQKKRAGIIIVIIIAALIATAAIVMGMSGALKKDEEDEQEAVITGEWESDGLVSLEDNLREWLIDSGISSEIAEGIVELAGLDQLGTLILTFTEKGNVYIGIGDVSAGLGTLTYEKLGENTLLIKYELDASVLGIGIPISTSYSTKYEVYGDKMILDLFGGEISFTRR